MLNYKYLFIGGGMTASAAIEGIRSMDKEGTIGIISDEKYKPYERPPLTKGLWHETDLDSLFLEMDERNVTFHLSTKATKINREKRIVTDSAGKQYQYAKLLIATGAAPKKISKESDRIIYYRYLHDFNRLQELIKKHSHFGIIGGGFIGSEIAAALRSSDKDVTMIFLEEGIGGLIFPTKLSSHLKSYYEEKGIVVHSKSKVMEITERGKKVKVKTDRQEFEFDALVIGIGVSPNVELAQNSGIKVENGIYVDDYLRTSDPDIYAAGDVSNFYNSALNHRMRVEHEENAYEQGAVAGKNMAGAHEKYELLPFFYSDLFDYGYEALGDLNPSLEIVEDWKDQYEEGVIYYLKNGIVVGVLLWNVWDQVEHARELISSKRKIPQKDLIGLLPK